ncbi:midasin [Aureobasidium pullulans]|uniref:Midasin n=1 Tax=Aureobasidium pullulans TaxID=5580 RepID=A0A4S9LYI3_AURPU|nr:midasin [Aureobasidium pullulans]
MDVSWETHNLVSRISQLPPELAETLQQGDGAHFLAQLSRAALDRRYTDLVLIHAESLIPHCCAEFQASSDYVSVVAAYARLVSLAPHVSEYAERYLSSHNVDSIPDSNLFTLEYFFALIRLLRFDRQTFAKFVPFSRIHQLLDHNARALRYLAIRVLCLYLSAADAALQDMTNKYLANDAGTQDLIAPLGSWEDKEIDYRLLTLWEERRLKNLEKEKEALLLERAAYLDAGNAPRQRVVLPADLFHTSTACISGVLLPRGAAPTNSPTNSIIDTPTTALNLRELATSLKATKPVLLTGLAGSGKTLLVRHAARQLNKLKSMVTLHLNEQSDAKLLIGMYTTGKNPGSFVWQAGVLTTAVLEGRWVFIEDLDRAPNDIISTLLPLIERNELVIPSRGQTIHAARGFRIIATMRTSLSNSGHETKPAYNLLGARHWKSVHVSMLPSDELKQVVVGLFPSLFEFAPQFVAVFQNLQALKQQAHLASRSRTGLMREVNPRDLLKWCARVALMLGNRPNMTAGELDQIFLDAVDCFAGALPEGTAYTALTSCIAENLQIDPQRCQHLLGERTIIHKEEPSRVTIGRSVFSRQQRRGLAGPTGKRAFSTNAHTLRLLDRVAVAVSQKEPLLLVGETGTGKTTSVQHLADQLGKKLVPFNLSQQSESGDLLGGFKPVNARSIIVPLKEEFDDLFSASFSYKRNAQFIEMLNKCMAKQQWVRVCKLWNTALGMVEQQRIATLQAGSKSPSRNAENPAKKRKVEPAMTAVLSGRWDKFALEVKSLENRLSAGQEAFAFAFVEGNIVKAVRNGDWVLLDEINLASPDTLEALADLFDVTSPSLMLSEAGSVEVIKAHPQFRVFAAMNPATDVGKKDLPLGIRSRFTELYVESPDRDYQSLRNIVQAYLGQEAVLDRSIASDVAKLHQAAQKLNEENLLVDGAGQKPHFSLRTLTRALIYAKDVSPLCSIRRAVAEGIQMSFLTLLDKESEARLMPLIHQHMFGKLANVAAELKKPFRQPQDGHTYVKDGAYWLRQGNFAVQDQPHYIITPFIRRNLDNLIRASFTRRFPVLIQGPTSAGKTSMIEYLANKSGNKFVRINNHEHTDLQEYLGTYVSGSDGRLQFQEGVLVKALREGHWIVLDELNLAPTDVLEALNRLLDDNRELLIPETQETVRPHENFMLFATQNPAGLYGGRKVLSRAFRNRFLELHFDDIPVEELHTILQRRTQIPDTWCKRIVSVYRELSVLRQENRLFEQKSFATLRDLFRWALRRADTIDELAVNGFLLLAERVRKPEEREAVKKVIEKVLGQKGPKVNIDISTLYGVQSPLLQSYLTQAGSKGVVWTNAMRRLYVLVATALQNNEPVLLVGETGCGKTTVVQMLADAIQKELHIVNAHQNTETGDLIGAQRPLRNRAAIEQQVREMLVSLPHAKIQEAAPTSSVDELLAIYDQVKVNADKSDPYTAKIYEAIDTNRPRLKALFEWADGSLVHAMKTGQYFLLDEISLADDSVLERLNSVLEPSREMLLAEKGSLDSFVKAQPGFQFFATMNPGGDYGKRELSPALRNRFTEIWVPALSDIEDVLQIIRSKLKDHAAPYANVLVEFAQWFNQRYNTSAASSISIRDTLAWVEFVNRQQHRDPIFSIIHGAAMVYIDTLGANPAALLAINPGTVNYERSQCLNELSKLIKADASAVYNSPIHVEVTDEVLELGAFSIPVITKGNEPGFTFLAPTTRSNAMRVIRALQLTKPVLLEGNPGVGKTTLVTALAQAIGMPLTRINLSEQTDLMDLFGSDVPVEGAEAGTFAWRDAPFLRAMKNGEWVLLDEMNLASQSVLEGLNACLDHRGEVYISELDQTFRRHPDFRLFAAQNPHHQGGGRKGLPASFVNRFTVVYADVFSPQDLVLICQKSFASYDANKIAPIVSFIDQLDIETQRRKIGSLGGPWEFNLRDTLRWLNLITADQGLLKGGEVDDFFSTIISQRFRTTMDRALVTQLFQSILPDAPVTHSMFHNIGPKHFQVGWVGADHQYFDFKPHLRVLESVMVAVQKRWPVLLVGPSGSGKTAILEKLAAVLGVDMTTFSMNADVDSMDLVGGFEQSEPQRAIHSFLEKLRTFAALQTVRCLTIDANKSALDALQTLRQLASQADTSLITTGRNDVTLEISHLLENFISVAQTSGSVSSSTFMIDVPEAESLLEQVNVLISKPTAISRAQFEWMDGMLVQALERGEWLVLDNANLCSPAVLDRLNSLLEPNGTLIINENTDASGQARVIKPHPNFRIFFTMDPRYGELSRALRNRAVELFLLSSTASEHVSSLEFSSESSLHRLRNTEVLENADVSNTLTPLIAQTVMESFSYQDTPIMPHFMSGLEVGLYHTPNNVLDKSKNVQFKFKTLHSSEDVDKQAMPDVSGSTIQPFHPLNNVALARCNLEATEWAAALYELEWDLHTMQIALEDVKKRDVSKREQTRLQRSAIGQGPKQKHFTSHVFGLLCGAIGVWSRFLDTAVSAKQQGQLVGQYPVDTFKPWRRYWWEFFNLVDSIDVEEAVFKAYIEIGVRLEQTHGIEFAARLTYSDAQAVESFSSYFVLPLDRAFSPDNKGASMTALWTVMRPKTARNFQQLQDIIGLEAMADRFDIFARRLDAPMDQLLQLQEAFGKALAVVLDGSEEAPALIASLKEAMSAFTTEETDVAHVLPHFKEQFEGIAQTFDLLYGKDMSKYPQSGIFGAIAGRTLSEQLKNQLQRVNFLAFRPTKSIAAQQGDIFEPLGKHVGFYSDAQKPLALETNLHQHVLSGLDHIDEVPLSKLDLLRTEAQIMAQIITSNTHDLEANSIHVLDGHLAILADVLLRSLREVSRTKDIRQADWQSWIEWASESFRSGKIVTPAPVMASVQDAASICKLYLDPLVHYLVDASVARTTDPAVSARAWLRFALACMSLYITSKPSDPALRPMLDRQIFRKTFADLQTKLAALQHFADATGLYSSLRTASVHQDITDLGQEPSVQDIARPSISEITKLQGELNALQRALAPLYNAPEDMLVGFAKDAVLRQNVRQVKARLSDGYRAYADITGPVMGFLHCLEVGFALASLVPEDASMAEKTVDIKQFSPLTGALPAYVQRATAITAVMRSPHHNNVRMHALSSFATMSRILPETQTSTWDAVYEIFDSMYEQWHLELQNNQQQNAADHSLYAYRGDEEAEDEATQAEMAELFPEFDTEESEVTQSKSAAPQKMQALAPGLATVLSEIYKKGAANEEDLLALVKKSASLLGKQSYEQTIESIDGSSGVMTPLLVLILQEKTQMLNGSGFKKNLYNIYTESNLAEADKLISLVRRVQTRFRDIQQVWPEHATLGDVLRICDELLEFAHTEPVAKIMTKVEKLHSYVHEWQVVASREYSAAALYDNITNLIVSWRQLELSTWSRLLDMETIRCNEDSKSWFYIAYENIVVVPLQIGETETEMRNHVTELIKTLYGFFTSTGLGQFSARLRMLGNFREYIKTRAASFPSFSIAHTALANFIAYMARYEPLVNQALDTGRQKLEKDMKNIIQLASWKDTNIDALRQSAKASHRKLFRVVRKFRALLAQPAQSIVSAGLPDIAYAETPTAAGLRKTEVPVDPKASSLCTQQVAKWNERPARFKNTATTLTVMQSKGTIKPEHIDCASEINTWLSDTESIAAQLRKATPTTLTEENTETVKHLKNRKRKLFADVIKELRNMGFKSNMTSDVLARQDSLQAVLAAIPVMDKDQAESYLHRLLYLMPLVREAAREHSDDLTGAEIARSVALCESMLQVLVQQRNVLGAVSDGQKTLETLLTQADNLWDNGKLELNGKKKQSYDTVTAVACLPIMIKSAARIVASQAELAKIDCSSVVKSLNQWAVRFEGLKTQLQTLPTLPAGITSEDHVKIIEESKTAMQEIHTELTAVIEQHRYLGATLRQLQLWALVDDKASKSKRMSKKTSLKIDEFGQAACDFVDSILGSVQDLEKPLSALPVSAEDPNWLLHESQNLSTAVKTLRLPYVTERMQELMAQVPQLDTDLDVAAAVVHSFVPFVAQYNSLAIYLSSRLDNLHAALGQMSFRLAKIFVQLSKEGFCTPSEKSNDQNKGDDKLEGGTGLGSGEGAEDISKDIEDDEDLGELAQEKDDRDDKDEIEDEKDAVDMADQEMEGQMGDAEEKEDEEGDEKEDEGEDEMEDEVGDVDDLGPSTVDEKMWDDGGKDEENKDKEGDNNAGTEDQNEMTAADGEEKEEKEKKENDDDAEEEDEAEQQGADETENGPPDETEKTDPHLQEQDNLDLPDDIDMDGKSEDGDESGMEDMGDIDPMDEDLLQPEGEQEGEIDDPSKEEDVSPEDEIPADLDAHQDEADENADEDGQEKTNEVGEDAEKPEEEEQAEEDQDMLQDNRKDDTNAADEIAPSEAQGAGLDDQQPQDDNKENDSGAAQRESGEQGAQQEQQQQAGAEGERGVAENSAAAANEEKTEDKQESLPYKKIGDALEKWYKQQKQIQDAPADKEERKEQPPADVDMNDAEFEHLQNEAEESDAQALGAANEDQAKAIDEEAGVSTNDKEQREDFMPEDEEEGEAYRPEEDVEMGDREEEDDKQNPEGGAESIPNAFVGDAQSRDIDIDQDGPEAQEDNDDSIEDVDHQLESAHISSMADLPSLSLDEARALYNTHESSTRNLSLLLAEHLRLLLTPTHATKMRGDYRTGKRLNIKRIIPYIASSYRRDKIWMRRSVPSKRQYQIMLAIDDSQSMSEGGAQTLAFDTMALLARALSILEAGELCILGFGEDVSVKLPFETPFTAEAGANVIRGFNFEQTRTNVKNLVAKSLDLFRAARLRAQGASSELWQLQLIVSDGVCEDHNGIRSLVRQAHEERIMMVFVIVDATASAPSVSAAPSGTATPAHAVTSALTPNGTSAPATGASTPAAAQKSKKNSSILDLQTAEFVKDPNTGEMTVKTVKYLDSFPFGYYLVVRDVRELPGVLAGALRQWFAEVVESQG